MPAYYTTNSSRSRKKKKVNPSKYEAAWRKHNKFLKSVRSPVITLDEYVDYVNGKSPKPKRNVEDTLSTTESKSYRRETPDIPSAGSMVGVATKKTPLVYNGDFVIGQAYNKGGYQVLSESEVKDPMTGKRR